MEQQELISGGVQDIASSLGLGAGEDPPEKSLPEKDLPEGEDPPVVEGDPPADGDSEQAPPVEGEDPPVVETAAAPPPGSWAKETHELWAKLPPEAQKQVLHREEQMLQGIEQYREFHGLGKAMKEVVTPYIPMIQSSGLDPAKAVAVLLQANYRLTNGPVESRRQAFLELGTSLGLIQQQGGQAGQQPAIPPELKARIDRMEQQMTNAQREQYIARRAEVEKSVTQFWETHPLAEEVADDMLIYLGAGVPIATAYEKAVFANPATREKELARLQKEAKAKADEKARESLEKARKATAANVRGRDTTRSPTEPKGKFLDEGSMMEDLRDIQSRSH